MKKGCREHGKYEPSKVKRNYPKVDAKAREIMLPVKEKHRPPGYRYYHGRRTARLALRLARDSDEVEMGEVDRFVVKCGALLHDIAKGRKTGEHGEVGAEEVEHHFSHILGERDRASVRAVVNHHNKRHLDRDFCVETRLVQDADLIDHLGYMEVWLTGQWAAAEGEVVEGALENYLERFGHDWWEYCLSHHNFDLSRRAMEKRLARFKGFVKVLRREVRGRLW